MAQAQVSTPGADVAGALNALGPNASLADQIAAIEKALHFQIPAGQTEIGALYAKLKAMGLDALANKIRDAAGQPMAPAEQAATFKPPDAAALQGPWFWPGLPVFIQGIERNALILAVALAGVAGGFALMSGGRAGK